RKWYCIFLMNGLHVVVLLAAAPAVHVTQGLLIGHEKSSTKGLDYLYQMYCRNIQVTILPVPPVGQVTPPNVFSTHFAWVKAQKEIAGRSRTSLDRERISRVQTGRRAGCKLLRSQNEELYRKLGTSRTCHDSKPFSKDAICHQCGEVCHWRRNCPIYLAELMKKKKLSQGAITSGIFIIELYSFPSTSWVYDMGCGTYICITTQGLGGSKKLKPGALSLYVGDGHCAAVGAIGEFHLCLPNGLVLILHNCHYAPSITRGIISVSRLYNDGFVNRFKNDNSISVSGNNLTYFNAIRRDDIYEIVLSFSNTNDSSMHAVSNKRAKLNLDSALLRRCRLGHISKKRIEKLQHDGLLDSTDIKSFKKCVSCMSGKMARKPYSHQVERATDLIGLIHTDEVENQFGKTIKSVRSDRGGKYMSREFLDHLKEHGIISHRTPHYTPQHNGVSERRNRTLLDMVCSMMSQTTLPKSFWDYAIEFAAHILNMVPTKKVDKTPYEV
nr:hypothetical protein [Tanacetum cinerariifolium]